MKKKPGKTMKNKQQLIEEKRFSFIIPVYDVPESVFKRCLLSVSDQDYPNIEVVIVPNGGDEKAEAMANEFAKGKDNWKVIPIKEKGACNARNVGFDNSTGDVVSFFNSDYIANPGMVRSWMDTFEKNPDKDFLYGAYEYRTMEKQVYWSKHFDEYSLDVANYIDCGFPLKREKVVKWDDEVKSLQDWDFWIRVVKNGAKGKFLGREISYIAEPPRSKGLSEDSHTNWVERVNFIKKKNNIPIRDICVASIGAPFHGLNIAKMLNADYRDDTIFKPHKYKALYLIGYYIKPDNKNNGHAQILRHFDNKDCRRIVHFVGADIYWLKSFSHRDLKMISGALTEVCSKFLCENELAQKELKELGFEAEIVPIPPYSNIEYKELPSEFSVGLYLTAASDFDKYLQRETLSIVKAMPDVKFYGYGNAELENFKASNFEHLGMLDAKEWEKFVYDRSAYLRLVKHDTRPMATDEFIMAGRAVITNIPSDHVDYVDTSGTLSIDRWDTFSPGFSPNRWPDTKKRIIQKIREVKKRQSDGGNVAQAESLAHSIAVRSELNKQVYIDRINAIAHDFNFEVHKGGK